MTLETRAKREQKRRDAGSVAVEFALLLPWLVILFIGAVDYATMMKMQSQLEAATRAGAECALINPNNNSGSCSIASTVANYASFSPAVTTGDVTVTTFCTCSDDTNVVCPGVGVSDPCPVTKGQTDTRVFKYVGVQASQTFQPVLSWGGVWPSSLTAGTVTRYQ